MFDDILTPMNHREIEYTAQRLSGCDIPDSFQEEQQLLYNKNILLKWLDETGKRVFDDDLVMDYGTDCLRLYLLFEQTPKENDAPYYDSWQEGALEGIYKFLGRYRRMILAADVWNRCGHYNNEETLSDEGVHRIRTALETTDVKLRTYINRGNTMPNRHNTVAVLMELLNTFQRELKIGQVLTSFHAHAVESAVPHCDIEEKSLAAQMQCDRRNACVTGLCREYIKRIAPYAPDLSKILWKAFL